MALIVEDGSGLATAESFISVLDAKAYLDKFGGGTDEWEALATEAEEEVHLRKGARYLEAEFGGGSCRGRSFIGTRGSLTQAFHFPAVGARTGDGFVLDSSGAGSIHEILKQANAILGSKSAAGELLPDQASPSTIKKKSVDLGGSIKVSTTYEKAADPEALYRVVESLLRPLLRSSSDLRLA